MEVTKDTKEFVSFLSGCKLISDGYCIENHYMVKTFRVTFGKKYAKIYTKDSQESVWCFIDLTNGDVLKPASHATPAKHARGNIFDKSNGLSMIGPYGPAYLK